MSIYDYSVKNAKNEDISLKTFEGKVLLVVNTATGCGFTPQYKDLERIYEKFNQKGFELEDADLKLLKDSPLIYLSYDSKDFSYLNYYYEYKVIKPIKSGGFAEVYLAENILNKQLVAIKKTDIFQLMKFII